MAKNSKEYSDKGNSRIPKSKFKCKKCGREFTSESYLNSHYCEGK